MTDCSRTVSVIGILFVMFLLVIAVPVVDRLFDWIAQQIVGVL